jgi:hypothetical protein
MRNYMPKVGTYGLDMMFRTCTVQVLLFYLLSLSTEGLPQPNVMTFFLKEIKLWTIVICRLVAF